MTLNPFGCFILLVPKQDNGFDCGLFVCLYAFVMLTVITSESGNSGCTFNSDQFPFQHIFDITSAYKFRQADIPKIRYQFCFSIWKLFHLCRQHSKATISYDLTNQESKSAPPEIMKVATMNDRYQCKKYQQEQLNSSTKESLKPASVVRDKGFLPTDLKKACFVGRVSASPSVTTNKDVDTAMDNDEGMISDNTSTVSSNRSAKLSHIKGNSNK